MKAGRGAGLSETSNVRPRLKKQNSLRQHWASEPRAESWDERDAPANEKLRRRPFVTSRCTWGISHTGARGRSSTRRYEPGPSPQQSRRETVPDFTQPIPRKKLEPWRPGLPRKKIAIHNKNIKRRIPNLFARSSTSPSLPWVVRFLSFFLSASQERTRDLRERF